MPTCISCSTRDADNYHLIEGIYQCDPCFKKGTHLVPNKQHLPMFIRWHCLTHNCGSYNFNRLGKHEMPWCDIVKEETVGILYPKTFGGVNGNVGRHYFRDWQEYARREDMQVHYIKAWQTFTKRIPSKARFRGTKYNIKKKKHGNRPEEVLRVTRRTR